MSNNDKLRRYIAGRIKLQRRQALRDLGMSQPTGNSALGALVKSGELVPMGDGWYRVTTSDRQRELVRLVLFGERRAA
ncbi:hypothetical protein [Oceanimonas smirnovii]|uniref:hypothetical protein n=1 Tax=Oceanimonas smirnovii TaxID=264574 RepID=UPI000591621B|nr:hypothetical protein [Oceanimonas smirnovii]